MCTKYSFKGEFMNHPKIYVTVGSNPDNSDNPAQALSETILNRIVPTGIREFVVTEFLKSINRFKESDVEHFVEEVNECLKEMSSKHRVKIGNIAIQSLTFVTGYTFSLE